MIPKITMTMSSGLNPERMFEDLDEAPPSRGLKPLLRFFHQEQKAGRIRSCDPEILARVYTGAMHHFAFAEWSGLNTHFPLPRQTYVRGVVDMMLHGILPPDGESSGEEPA